MTAKCHESQLKAADTMVNFQNAMTKYCSPVQPQSHIQMSVSDLLHALSIHTALHPEQLQLSFDNLLATFLSAFNQIHSKAQRVSPWSAILGISHRNICKFSLVSSKHRHMFHAITVPLGKMLTRAFCCWTIINCYNNFNSLCKVFKEFVRESSGEHGEEKLTFKSQFSLSKTNLYPLKLRKEGSGLWIKVF